MAVSPVVRFRAVPPLNEQINARSLYPEVLSDPGLQQDEDEYPKASPGGVAARDLAVYYRLIAAELVDAELTRDEALMIVDATRGLLLDFTWTQSPSSMLASEVEDAFGDNEDGPDLERKQLAERITQWPRLRALAVVEAARAAWALPDIEDLDAAMVKVGLVQPERPRRRTSRP
ncbi:hypothetical protein ACFWCA_19035 [Streptomyces phaeochromogenes]|uniref:hypothetical protein n=1 Tax=Streptomyces phaeochromogenes TaxID=1923 RepID=UPI003696989F